MPRQKITKETPRNETTPCALRVCKGSIIGDHDGTRTRNLQIDSLVL